MSRDYSSRYTLLGTLFTMLAALIFGQHVSLLLDHQRGEILEEVRTSHLGSIWTIHPPRGLIFDRKGQLLAGNEMVYEVGIDYRSIDESSNQAHTIALTSNVYFGLDYYKVKVTIENPPNPHQVYLPLAKGIEKEKVDQLQNLLAIKESDSRLERAEKARLAAQLDGLVLQPYMKRVYPEPLLASNVLGFVGYTQQGLPEGYFGVEAKYNEMLSGTPIRIWVPNDPRMVREFPPIPEGASLILTIDRELQAAVERILEENIQKTGSETGVIVVLDPKSGEVWAMASYPRLDISRYWEYETLSRSGHFVFNRAISAMYEPGSVFKVLTMAAALDKGVVTEETTFLDKGAIEVGGLVIYNWDRAGHGKQTMQGCMQLSLNVCLAWVATQLGAPDFYAYLQAFGIGHTTGIDLDGERAGILKLPHEEYWSPSEIGTNSFGQGVSVTPIQMASAISALANEGKIMRPHVVRAIVKEGEQFMISPSVSSIPISAKTARSLTEMLARSLEAEASVALVEGYRVAGKTGTGEIAIPNVGYTSNETNASFAGWGPVDDPRFVVYIWLEKPSTSIWGSEVAAPIFPQVVKQIALLMNIPPDRYRKAAQ
ncbi:MAG: penicillin-binding protein 2 [Anaerolineales bacterium]|nr:penicillin-binding protein 2 [Anaerolineales bacterium]MDW8160485.1 penicillin-binding protein 2 [Anaerolineales bacterium]